MATLLITRARLSQLNVRVFFSSFAAIDRPQHCDADA
jgi:hypothetical protein